MPGTIRIVLGGRVIGAQRWSVGHTLAYNTTAPAVADLSTLAEAALARFKSNVFVGSGAGKLAAYNSTQTTLDSARAYLYPDGSTSAAAIGTSSGASVAGTISSSASVPQAALVATLEDGLAGRAHKGRMYLPLNAGLTSATTLQLDNSTVLAFATSVATYLATFVNAPPVSGRTDYPVVSGLTRPNLLTSVSVDTVIDTQRRRRDKVVGTRARFPITIG